MRQLLSRRDLLVGAGGALSLIAGSAGRLRAQTVLRRLGVGGACYETSDEMYYDENDLIVQRDCDGGDTAQREGMYCLGNWLRVNRFNPPLEIYGEVRKKTFVQVMDLLEDPQKTGKFRGSSGFGVGRRGV